MATISENQKEGKTVSFRIRVFFGRDENNKQIVSYSTWHIPKGMTIAKARKEVKKYAVEWEKEQRENYRKKKYKKEDERNIVPFSSFVKDIWIPLIIEDSDRKPKTINTYKYIADKICGYFLEQDIQGITTLDLQRYIHFLQTDTNNKNAKPLSRKTIRHHYCVLNMIFDFALDNEVVVKNPMVKVKPPKMEKKRVEAFTKEEARKMLFFLEETDLEFQCMMLLMLMMGLRRGETLGLIWNDINFDKETIRISRSVSQVQGVGIVVDEPKTDNSYRTIPLPEFISNHLLEYRNCCGDWRGSDFVFHGIGGGDTPRDPDAITRRVKRFMKNSGLPDMSPHDLRHSCATLLLQSGADIKSVQEIMGHADASTTLKYYVRTDLEQMRVATDKLESILK